jgi:predicted LPLAT superfamily acyltransferase
VSDDWSARPEGGGRFAIWLLSSIALRCGRGVARALLYPVTLYFVVRRGPERRASRAFLGIALGHAPNLAQVLRHLYRYAATTLDRVFLLTDAFRRFDVRVNGLDALHAQMDRGRGVILLGAHIGSFEVLRVLGERRPDARVCVVMDRQQTPGLTAMLHALNPKIAANVIDAGADPAEFALAVHAAAQSGALIGLLGDRARPGESVQPVEFFGARAAFPVGPYLLAAVLELPVVLCFGLYRGGNRYDLYFETFAEELRLSRGARAAQLGAWAQRYAARLEHYTRLDPYNWFNFYDFWHSRAAADGSGNSASPAATGAAADA